MYCTHCSAKIEEDHIFCPTCGKRLSEHPHTSRTIVWLKRVFWTFAIFALSYYFYFSSAADPYDTVISQLKAIGSQELTKAYYGYTSPTFQEVTSLEVFKDYLRENPHFSTLVKADIVRKQEVDDKAILQVLLTPSNGEPFTVEYHLVKLEDGWKVSDLKQVESPSPTVL